MQLEGGQNDLMENLHVPFRMIDRVVLEYSFPFVKAVEFPRA